MARANDTQQPEGSGAPLDLNPLDLDPLDPNPLDPDPLDLESFTKYLPLLVLVAYGIGVLAINTYLHYLGIADFSLAKPKLVLTGALVLLTFFLLALSPFSLAWRLAYAGHPERRTLPPNRQMLLWMILPLVLLVAASAALCFRQSTGLGQIAVWRIWEQFNEGQKSFGTETLASLILAGELYLPVCIAAFAALQARRLLNRVQSGKHGYRRVTDRIHLTLAVAVTLASFVGYIDIFSLTFYPAIPLSYGGGKPYFESFVIADNERCQLQRLGVPLADAQQSLTMPLPVLHESDTLLAVWLRGVPSKDQQRQDKTKQPNTPENLQQESQETIPDGFGRSRFIVVQLDKSQIVAARAHPHLDEAPMLARRSIPCSPPNASPADTSSTPGAQRLK